MLHGVQKAILPMAGVVRAPTKGLIGILGSDLMRDVISDASATEHESVMRRASVQVRHVEQ